MDGEVKRLLRQYAAKYEKAEFLEGDPSAEELMTLRLSDLGVKLKDPAASDED